MQTVIMHIVADVSKQDMNRMANIGMKRQLRIAPAVAMLDEHKTGTLLRQRPKSYIVQQRQNRRAAVSACLQPENLRFIQIQIIDNCFLLWENKRKGDISYEKDFMYYNGFCNPVGFLCLSCTGGKYGKHRIVTE